MIIANKHRNNRIWERPDPDDIVAEAIYKKGTNLINRFYKMEVMVVKMRLLKS